MKDVPRDEGNFLTVVFQSNLKKGASSVRRIMGINIDIVLNQKEQQQMSFNSRKFIQLLVYVKQV